MEFARRKGSARRKVSRRRVRADIFNYSGHITKNKMERPSLTGDCAWQASFPVEEQPYSSDLFSRRDTPPPRPSLYPSIRYSRSSSESSPVAGPATPAFVFLRLLVRFLLFHPCFTANLINDCSIIRTAIVPEF